MNKFAPQAAGSDITLRAPQGDVFVTGIDGGTLSLSSLFNRIGSLEQVSTPSTCTKDLNL